MHHARLILSALAVAAAAGLAVRPAAAQDPCAGLENAALAIAMEPITLAPGESKPVDVSIFYTYRPSDPLPAGCPVTWSVEPAGSGTVANGRLSVSRSARPGAELTVVARVAGRTVRQAVHVIEPGPHPLAGYWSQRDSADCSGGAGQPRPEPVRELILRPDSLFSLTAVPFETRRDYWGRYSFAPSAGTLRFVVQAGNDVPEQDGLEGHATVDGDTLRLEGFWLGDAGHERAGRTCSYVFTRRH